MTKALRKCYCLYVHLLAGEKGANDHLNTFDEVANVLPLRLVRGQMS